MQPLSGTIWKAPTARARSVLNARIPFLRLARFSRNLRALLARLRKSDRDGLLARSYFAAFSAFAGIKRAALFSVHRALHTFSRSLTVFPSRTFFCWHFLPSCRVRLTTASKVTSPGRFCDSPSVVNFSPLKQAPVRNILPSASFLAGGVSFAPAFRQNMARIEGP